MSDTLPERKNRTFRDQRSAAERIADEQIKERVLLGLEFLKQEHGEAWVDHIDPERLDLSDASCCVLGQLGGFNENVNKIVRATGDINGDARRGFNCGEPDDDADAEFEALTQAWRAVITADPLSSEPINLYEDYED